MELFFCSRSNYVLKYRFLLKFVMFVFSCKVAIRRPGIHGARLPSAYLATYQYKKYENYRFSTETRVSRYYQYEKPKSPVRFFVTSCFWSRHVFGLASTKPDWKVFSKQFEWFRPSSEQYDTSSEFQTSTENCVSHYHQYGNCVYPPSIISKLAGGQKSHLLKR